MLYSAKHPRALSQQGFTLIELAIVLAVAGLLFVGLWRLIAGGNQQLRDQGSASQQSQLISAVKGYLASAEGQSFMQTNNGSTASFNLPLPTSNTSNANCKSAIPASNKGFCDFLPAGFTGTGSANPTTNSYGQTFAVRIVGDGKGAGTAPLTYSFMIMTSGGDTIPDTSGGRISSLIGNDGGFIYSTNVCGAAASTWACGAYGAWSANVNTIYGFSGVSGTVASRTYVSPEQTSSTNWLARVLMSNDPAFAYNTMQPGANLFIGGNGLYMATTIAATSGGGSISMQGGAINFAGGLITSSANPASQISMVNTSQNPAIISQIQIASGCQQSSPGTGCPYSLNITGDANVSNFMNVNTLYANTFIYQSSDIRLKTDIHPLVNPLADVMKMNPVSFAFKSNGHKSLGVIAQDIEKIYPELVSEGTQGMKSVNYEGLIGPLIGAVQELKKENDELRSKLDAQARRQDELERELSSRKAP